MLSFVVNIIPTIVVLGLLIFIHELGHFIFAKASGVEVEKFSLGFGPEIIKFSRKGTVYAISLVPLGGFVKMAGETIEEREEEDLKSTDYLSQGIVKRFLIIFAGPLMNYVLAFVLLIGVFALGKPTLGTRVGQLVEDYPAAAAGIQVNDTIISIDRTPVQTWDELRFAIAESAGETVTVRVNRNGNEQDIAIVPKVTEEKNPFGEIAYIKKVGIVPGEESLFIKYGFIDSVKLAGTTTYSISALTLKSIWRLVTGRLNPKALSGPLGIMVITTKTAQKGIVQLVQLTAFLSISLAIFNLLPIPALDGGHLLFIFCEMIIRKPISFKLQERFAQVGFALLMTLMVFVVWNDARNFEIVAKIKALLPFVN